MGFFDSFKKKSDNPEEKSQNNLTNESTEEIVDDNVYIRDTETGEISKEIDNQPKETISIDNEKVELPKQEETNNQTEEEFPKQELKEQEDEKKETIIENEPQNNKKDTSDSENKKTEDVEENKSIDEEPNESELKNNHKENLILSILNQKGGVGKSTTAINLAAALGEKGMKILLVDLDPQGNTSSGLGIEKKNLNKCIYDVLLSDTNLGEVIVKGATKNVDVVPATINLAGAEVELVSEIAREQRLKDALEEYRDQYDYIFVDCPPSLGLLTVNALVAADQLLIPIQCEFYALEGVTKLLDSMKRVKSRLNRDLDIFGVVLTMYDNRTTLSKQVTEEVEKFFGDKVFDSKIPRTVKISEAPSFGLPINEYEPLCKGAIMYESLAEEVMNRG